MDGLYSHSAYLLQELQEQRIQGLLCDCMLVVKGVCFKAHKNVLAAFSSYFRSLFQNSSALKNDVYHLTIQDVGGIGQILDYMYTSHLELNQDNAHTLLHIAQCLQVSNILSMCNAYLKQSNAQNTVNPPLSLPALLSHEPDCVLGNPLPPEPDPHCQNSDPNKILLLPNPDGDTAPYKRPHPAQVSGPSDAAGNLVPLLERQPLHSYKLRNFYSKQYFKQSANQSCSSDLSQRHCPQVVAEQYNSSQVLQNTSTNTANQTLQNTPPTNTANQTLQNTPQTNTANQTLQNAPPTNTANQTLQNTPPTNTANQTLQNLHTNAASQSLAVSAANQTLLPGPLNARSADLSHLSETSQTPASCASTTCPEVLNQLPLVPTDPGTPSIPTGDVKRPPSPRDLRPKKAVYLKKFNYLRSHHALNEGAERSQVTDSCSAEPVRQAETQNQSGHTGTDAVPEGGVSESAEAAESNSAPQPPSPPKPQPEQPLSIGQREGSETTSNKYCCEMCGKTFKHPSNLELHKRSHTGEKPFQCNVCGKSFSQAGNLQTHLRRHSGEKPYICELCGKSFAASGDVQRHIIIHSGARPHLCDICGRGFSNFSNLKEHKKTHSSDKEFVCDQCGKSFNMQRKLLKHTMRHTGEKPYCCQTCGKCFAGSGDLQRHVRSHTGERPYVCDTCGKGFTRTAVLRRHRTHCRPVGGADTGDTGTLTQLDTGDAGPLTQLHTRDTGTLSQTDGMDTDRPAHTAGKATAPHTHTAQPANRNKSQSCPPASTLPPAGTCQPTPPLSDLASSTTPFPLHSSSSSSSSSLSEMRSVVPHHVLALPPPCKSHLTQQKDPLPPIKPVLHLDPSFSSCSEENRPHTLTALRPHLLTSEAPCSNPPATRSNSAPYRTSEGYCSSGALWGLAMKTLQSDSNMDQ